MYRKIVRLSFWMFIMLCTAIGTVGAQPNPAEIIPDPTPVPNASQLVKRSDLIVYVKVPPELSTYPTHRSLGEAKIINYTQPLRVIQTWKGPSAPVVHLLTSGLEPVPPPDNPLNDRYSGPIAEGDYVCFLQHAGTNLYSIVGVWQGLYPVEAGRAIALERSGFPVFSGLPLDAFRRKIAELR